MSTARKLIRGSLVRNVELFVLLGASFWITPFIVHSLGDRMYGFWTLVGTFMGYYNLMNYGIYAAASRYVAQSLGRGDEDEVNRTANTAFSLLALIGAATLVATALAAAACPLFLSDPDEVRLFREVLTILGVATAVGFPLNLFGGIMTANVRYDAVSGLSIAKALVSNAAIYAVLRAGHGIAAVAMVTAAANLLQNAASYAVCRAQLPYLRLELLRFERDRARAMFDYGWKVLVCQVGDILRFQIDSLLIAGFLNASLLTPFSIGVRLVDGFSSLMGSSVGMMSPVFSQYEGRGDVAGMRAALLRVTAVTTILSTFVGLSVLFYGRAFILRWMGPGFESSYTVTLILCSAFMLHMPQSPGVQLLYGLSKHDSYATLNIVAAVANVVMSVLFLRSFGMYGVVLGTAAEIVLFRVFVQPVLICRAVELPLRSYLFDSIFATMAKSAVPLAAYFWAVRGLVRPEYPRLIACGLLQALVFAPIAYFFIIDAAERDLVRKTLRLPR